jgi:cysteine desulfurase/selenocysteine lyase
MPNIDLHRQFPHLDDLIYLNHAGVGPWPRRTAETIEAFARENMIQGPLRYPEWLRIEATLRDHFRKLLNAPSPDDIALVKSTSEALSLVAYGLDWRDGDNVVIPDQEFPSNRIVWESLAPLGVSVRQVDLSGGESPEAALLAAVDQNTRLLSVSSVQYATGLRMDLQTLGAACRRQNVLFCVDAIQSLGAVPMDIEKIQADFVMADGHKWLLGPEGLGVFYCRAELRDRLQLRQYGWHMVERHGDYDRRDWVPARSARRFECGSPNMLAIHGLEASLSLLLQVGLPSIEKNVLKNSRYLIDCIASRNDFTLLTPAQDGRFAGIVTFRHDRVDSALINERLREKGVVCAVRGGGIRFSPHFYTPREKLEAAMKYLTHFVDKKK